MSRELRICPGVGDRKCGAFLSLLDRDSHPTCTRCRGKVCTKDMTCDFCAVWSAEQWELFTKKRSYKERKQRPSGSVPPAQETSSRAETSSEVSRPGTSASSSSLTSGGQEKRGGSRGAPGVVLGGAPSPPARPRSSERGGSASRHSSGASGLAPSSPSPSGGGAGVARSLQTPLSRVSEAVDSPQFSPHVPQRENSRESSVSGSRVLSSRDSCSSGRGSRKEKRVRSRESSSGGRRRRSRSRSSSRSRSRGRERRQRSSSASLSSRVSGHGLLTATALGVEALGCVVTGLDPRNDTGHAMTALDGSGRGLLTATARVVSELVPLPAGGSGVTVRGRTLSRIAHVTARGQACDYLLPLPACGPRRQDGWPDEEPRRVWRRLPLGLLWFLEQRRASLLLQEGHPLPLSRLLCRSLPSSSWACQVPLPWELLETWRV